MYFISYYSIHLVFESFLLRKKFMQGWGACTPKSKKSIFFEA